MSAGGTNRAETTGRGTDRCQTDRVTPMLAAIPYTTFPEVTIGPLTLRTFGAMVGLGVLIGAWVAARYVERFGVSREDTYKLATRLVIAGIVGSRLTWVVSHWDQIDSPIDIIAVWEGGLQFSGGFIAAVIVGIPTFRTWSRPLRWRSLDGYALGLTIGLAIGRIGCYSVGEHFGSESDFFLANRYDGGDVREHFIGDERLVPGMTFHNTSLYELLHLLVLFGLLWLVKERARRRSTELPPGTLVGIFTIWYGLGRFVTDFARVNDNTVLGLTGAQFMTLAMVPAGLWILFRVRHLVAAEPFDIPDPAPAGDDVAEAEGEGLTDDVRACWVDESDESGASGTDDVEGEESDAEESDVEDDDVERHDA